MFRKMTLVALLLGCISLFVGCDELAKANDKSKADDKAHADKSAQSEAAKSSKKPSGDAVEMPTTDPLIAGAIQTRQSFADQEELLLDRLDELRLLLGSAKADPARIRQSVDDFLALAREIRRVVIQASDSLASLDTTTNDLARSMKHLGLSYRSAAGLFREKARDYSSKKLRDQLNGFADDYEAIAKTIPERISALEAFQKTLPKWKLKVREANAFLDDTVLFLSSHPGIGADPRERYSAQFESFVLTFSDLIRTLEEFREVLRARAISKVIREGHRKEALAKEKLEAARKEDVAKAERLRVEAIERQALAQREAEQLEQAKREEAERSERKKLERAANLAPRAFSSAMRSPVGNAPASFFTPTPGKANFTFARTTATNPLAPPPTQKTTTAFLPTPAPVRTVVYYPTVYVTPFPRPCPCSR